ncbi:alpha/beta fold hydrolase [Sphingomonas sp. S2-65]|uniref:alpha/beta fold hydrolase n=1 Tax=Sphingomonas sp. S2-65 TaxID=2903960 RepID=UPI001F177F2A|nr:alpha/beta hydrolase [Sphingomonas sp. S2-65]UYY58085.1 alpha/beta hydrolase [Sphingomonas sp. S2-65]
MDRHSSAPTRYADVGDKRYAYRRFGAKTNFPIVLLQHFTGGLDHWDPLLTDGLAEHREVILVDNAGVGASTGQTPTTIEGMADCILEFVDALKLESFDVVGFSMGGMVAQALAKQHPARIRRLILAGTSPRGGDPTPHQAEVSRRASGSASLDDFLWLFFGHSEAGKAAGRAFWNRRHARTEDRDPPSGRETIMAQVAAGRDWLQPHGQRFEDLKSISMPTLVVNGSNDVMLPTINSYHLAQHIPNALLILYPDAGHAAHFQYPELFLSHAKLFLAG